MHLSPKNTKKFIFDYTTSNKSLKFENSINEITIIVITII